MKNETYIPGEPNSGHGHVYPRPDGAKARCGGPRICLKCAADQRQVDVNTEAHPVTAPPSASWPPIQPGAPITEPCIAVPAEFPGTEAEAIALAVAGAVASLVSRAEKAEVWAADLESALRALVDTYPRTSFASSEAYLEEAVALLAQHRPDQTP